MTCDNCRFAAWRNDQIGTCTWRATIPVAASSGIAGGALTVQGGFIWRGFDLECVVGLPPE